MNPHWGEQMRFGTGNKLDISMVFQGLTQRQAEEVWKPFREWLAAPGRDVKIDVPLKIVSGPARTHWSAQLLKAVAPGAIVADDRPKAPAGNYYWAATGEEVGWVLYAFRSAWLPVSLLQKKEQPRLVEALFESTRHWQMSLHFNKGLAGAPAEEIAAAKDTAINPAVLDAFALAICAAAGPPAFPGVRGHEPNLNEAGRAASAVTKSMNKLLEVVDEPGSYVSENDFFESQWRRSNWGSNYLRLAAVKKKYDPDGLFTVHHGVGSEEWSADGFTRLGPG
jgi:FAD/FMN-containing dehydrogenase